MADAGFWNWIASLGGVAVSSGYDVLSGGNRRRRVTNQVMAEDLAVDQHRRRQLNSEVRDLNRNSSLLSWAVRRHLDYVSKFSFASDDDRVEELMTWYQQPLNCDVRGLHGLLEMIRLAEGRRTVDGDVLAVKLSSGLLQWVESDRVRTPPSPQPGSRWSNGVRLSRAGRPQAYGLWNRAENSYSYSRTVPSRNAWLLGYHQRFDQVRGISPISAACNQFRDLREAEEYELAKMKVLAACGLVITSPLDESVGQVTYTGSGEGEDQADKYEVSLGSAPWKLELEPGDKAELMTGDTPGNSWREFFLEVVGVAIKSLDLPFSMYDGKGYNFSQSKAELNSYLRAVECRQAQLIWLLDQITAWRLSLFVLDGELEGPVSRYRWEWVPSGVPWWNPVDEVEAALAAIDGKIDTRENVVRRMHGRRWVDIIDRLKVEEGMLEDRGLKAQAPSMIEQLPEDEVNE